jgi:transcriptional/translational regulatory protein YebC/TACO1
MATGIYYIPYVPATDVSKPVDKLEQDEDVQKVFHNMG